MIFQVDRPPEAVDGTAARSDADTPVRLPAAVFENNQTYRPVFFLRDGPTRKINRGESADFIPAPTLNEILQLNYGTSFRRSIERYGCRCRTGESPSSDPMQLPELLLPVRTERKDEL